MTDALILAAMSPGLLKVVERAQREPEGRFNSLAHPIDVPTLKRAYRRQRADAAVGVNGVTKEAYGRNPEANLRDLHARLQAKRYRHQPIRRVHIPKAQGKIRPIGVSAFEDKWGQDAVREVLEAIYEQDFLDCSHGFRPGRRAHDAARTLKRMACKTRRASLRRAKLKRPSTTGAVATGTYRSRISTPRSIGAYEATSITSASVATTTV